jgi:hypothetical protein
MELPPIPSPASFEVSENSGQSRRRSGLLSGHGFGHGPVCRNRFPPGFDEGLVKLRARQLFQRLLFGPGGLCRRPSPFDLLDEIAGHHAPFD